MKRAIWSICLLGIWASFFCAGPEGPRTAKGQVQGRAGESDFVAGYIASQKKGYIARPCGFDMNRNGILGEPADRLVGDGKTADPDGDGVAEDILYVDAVAGSDDSGDGSTAKPFKTIQKAIDSADGPADGAEDIICISGVFHEALTLKKGGVPGHYAHDGFEFPSNPVMIVGWDKDGDGEYPPYDKDDVAVLDGRNSLRLAINNKPKGVGYLEIAHLTIRDYGALPGPDDQGAIRLRGLAARPQSHIYVHDVEFRRINKAALSMSNTMTVNFFPAGPGTPTLSHVAFINNLFDEFSSYCFRGAGRGGGAYRFQSNTLRMYGPEGDKVKLSFSAYATGWKLWATLTGIEILDNVIDGNPRAWRPRAYASGIGVCQCSQDWTIRGNVFLDLWNTIGLQGDAGRPYCQSRTVNNVVIDRNIIRNTYDGWAYPPQSIGMSGGKPGSLATATVEDVTITNNFISSTIGWHTGISCLVGNYAGPQVGTITIAGNTILGPFGLFGNSFAQHGISIYPQSKFRPQSFVIKNNIIANSGPGKRNVGVNYAPSKWVAEGNVYDPASGFIWDNVIVNFSEWKKATGQDASSTRCKVAFVDVSGGDLHLKADDKCAAKVGVDITDITRVDFDGDPRSAENPTAGADAPRR